MAWVYDVVTFIFDYVVKFATPKKNMMSILVYLCFQNYVPCGVKCLLNIVLAIDRSNTN
jgi:hypothetical protein